MPTVTRSTLWFYAAEIPYVDFEVKGIQIFFNFKESLTYCIPDGSVKGWSFWLIADDGIEMSCSHSDLRGPEFGVYNKSKGIHITVNITETEARQIKQAVESMIEVASSYDEEFPLDESIRVLKPSSKEISYPVKAYRWVACAGYGAYILH